jgi:hypothetical protein
MIAAIAAVLVTQEQRNVDDPVQRGKRGQITAASSESFLRARRLQQAIDTVIAAAPGTTITSLRITPTQVNATMHHPDGREESFTVDPALELRRFSTGARRRKGLAPSKIPVGVPNRLVSLAVDRLELQPEDLDYVLLSVFDSPNQPSIVNWGLYYSEPPLDNDAVANLDGTDLRLMGTPDAAARASARKNERQAAKARSAAKRAVALAKARMEAAGR